MTLWLSLLLAALPAFGAEKGVSLPKTAALPVPVAPAVSVQLPALAPNVALPAALPGAAAVPSAAAAAAPAAAAQAAAPAAVQTASALAAPNASPSAAIEAYDGARPLRIIQAASEAVPFVKTGGLADVVDALGRGLAKRGHEVTLILPKYGVLKTGKIAFTKLDVSLPIEIGGETLTARVWEGRHAGVRVLLIENEDLYGKGSIYGDASGGYGGYGGYAGAAPGKDGQTGPGNDVRFGFYQKAVLAVAEKLRLDPDVIHSHDWQTGLLPAMLKLERRGPGLEDTKTVLTLHNMAFQGGMDSLPQKLGFRERFAELMHDGFFSFLKSGIVLADKITTVSPNYAREIKTTREFGMGLEGELTEREKDLSGVLNGVDPELWSPKTDADIQYNYDVKTAADGKAANKAALQLRSGLPIDRKKPMFGVVSRLSDQKGIDFIMEVIPELAKAGAQFVLTGSGDEETVRKLRTLEHRYPDNVFIYPYFSEEMARMIYAAADFLLMPSRFEPCGLSQLMAQLYGTLPIVTPVGGLVDTVKDIDARADGDGLVTEGVSAAHLLKAVLRALRLYDDAPRHAQARANAMSKDSSWDKPVVEYERLYRELTGL